MAGWMHCVESGANYEAEYRLRSKDGVLPLVPGTGAFRFAIRREDREMVRNLF